MTQSYAYGKFSIDNGWNIHIVQILHEINDDYHFSKDLFPVEYQNRLTQHTSGPRKI